MRGYLTVLLITVVDYLAGPDLSFLIFYFLPIIAISWFLGKKHGIAIAIVAALATSVHDLLLSDSYSLQTFQDLMIYWNFLQRVLVFLTVSTIVVALRASEDEKREVEHKVARQVQSFLTPHATPPLKDFDYSGHSKSSDQLSGDLFDCFLVGPNKLAFMIGDICGKGVSAALLMAYIQGVLRSHAPLGEDNLVELMKTVNRSLHASTADDKFATLLMGIYDASLRTLTYVNAGHEPPRVLRWKSNGSSSAFVGDHMPLPPEAQVDQQHTSLLEVLKLSTGGLLLGIDPSEDYPAHVMKLRLGDILVCDTDGLEEASNDAGQHYGHDRLTKVVAENRDHPSSRIHSLVLKDIQQFVGAGPQVDDMTLLVGKVM